MCAAHRCVPQRDYERDAGQYADDRKCRHRTVCCARIEQCPVTRWKRQSSSTTHQRNGPRFPPIAPGNRSLLHRFDSLETAGRDEGFGAVVEHVEPIEDGYAVQLWFWADLAAVYATPGVPFEIWYGGIAGSGSVLRIVE